MINFKNNNISELDLINLEKLVINIINKQESIRVIPLIFLDDKLENKRNWNLVIFGKTFQIEPKIIKFFNSVQRWKNGFKSRIFGADGYK